MNAMKIFRAALFLAAVPVLAVAAPQTGWFDLENCDMCRPLTEEEGMLQNVDWESHVIATGMMSVTRVPGEYAEAWGRAMVKMADVRERMAAGEKVRLCDFCQSMGGIVQAGATVDNLTTGSGQVMVVTARDEATIELIHAHARRTIEEHAKMVAGSAGHEGHAHAGEDHDH